MFLVVVPMVLAILALRRASRAPAVPAAMSVLLHPLCIVAAYLWFTHHRYIHHVVAWLPQEPEFMQFLPGLLVTSFLPVAGAVLVFRRDSRQSAPEPAVSELPSPVG
ncbi:MAG: hypothetical protein H8E59_02580 [Actinobacteria bacterium]|nr:hypothetical protein [Actinomycetota bacterium]